MGKGIINVADFKDTIVKIVNLKHDKADKPQISCDLEVP
jgi:hypothetical protein